jgi:hypothetical protein
MKKSFFLLIICVLFLAAVSSCKKEVKVSGIIVEPKNLYLSKGDVAQLVYMITPYSADNKSVSWTSRDASVATVSATGLVTAISGGKTQIVATTNDGHLTDTVSVTVVRGSPAGDSIALVKLYEIASHLPYWDLSKPMDTWEGVVLNKNRRVLKIGYPFCISKPLDVSIGNLACLISLSITADYYADPISIPPEIEMLTELQHLVLWSFTGTIPLGLENLTKLETLGLFGYKITGNIPKELGNLTHLKRMQLESCLLTGSIPKELGNLAKLETLYLGDNQLTGTIPEELTNLKNLYNLNLTHNSLSGNIPQLLLKKFSYWSFCPQNGTKFDNLDCGEY